MDRITIFQCQEPKNYTTLFTFLVKYLEKSNDLRQYQYLPSRHNSVDCEVLFVFDQANIAFTYLSLELNSIMANLSGDIRGSLVYQKWPTS